MQPPRFRSLQRLVRTDMNRGMILFDLMSVEFVRVTLIRSLLWFRARLEASQNVKTRGELQT